jgi:hypothetical protein
MFRFDLLRRLHVAVDQDLPVVTINAQPTWKVFTLPGNPNAPITAISRDSRAGPKVVPVFFITMESEDRLMEFASSLYQQSGTVARLWHCVGDATPPYLVVPAMFHELDGLESFRVVIKSILQELESTSLVAWFCEVMITHHRKSYRAISDQNGFRVVGSQ